MTRLLLIAMAIATPAFAQLTTNVRWQDADGDGKVTTRDYAILAQQMPFCVCECDCTTSGFCLERCPCVSTPSPSPAPVESPAPSSSPAPTPTIAPSPSPSHTPSATPKPPSPTPSPLLTPPTPSPNALQPIANWASVPGEQPQVIAFSKAGVWGVVFMSAGQPFVVQDGPIYHPPVLPTGTVSAVVYGLDGGRRDLGERPVGQGYPRVIRGQENPTIGSGEVWVDGCTFTTTPQTTSVSALYMTNCMVRNAARAVGNSPNVVLVRGCKFYSLTEDACQNVPTVINMEVHGITGTKAGNHSDVLQVFGSGGGPFIWYHVVADDVGYQGIAARTSDGIDGLALVDSSITIKPPIEGAGNYIQGPLRHAVIAGNTFTGYSGDPGYGCDWWSGSDPVSKRGEWSDVLFSNNTIGVYRIYTSQFTRCEFKDNTWGTTRKDGMP